jgi:uncharacterized protein YneF (UPF0154 family)
MEVQVIMTSSGELIMVIVLCLCLGFLLGLIVGIFIGKEVYE